MHTLREVLHFLWVAFWEYLRVWITGVGVVGLLLGLLRIIDKRMEEKGREPMKTREYLFILFCAFWFFGTFAAWHDSEKNLAAVEAQRAADNSQLNACQLNRGVSGERLTALGDQNTSLQTLIAGQQDTFNRCIVALGAKKEEPLTLNAYWVRTSVVGFDQNNTKRGYVAVIIAHTSKRLDSINVDVTCNQEFSLFNAQLPATNLSVTPANNQTSNDSANVVVSLPWSPGIPLVMTVFTQEEPVGGSNHPRCGIKQHV